MIVELNSTLRIGERGVKMTNTEKPRIAIKCAGLKLGYIADNLGITRESLNMKMRNETEFKASEIVTLKRILNLTDEERNDIFLNEKLN